MPGRRPPRNEFLRAARTRLLSPSGSGRPLSSQELAEAVNSYLWREHGIEAHLDETDTGKLERGLVRWPGAHRREAFRAILGAASDAELGFYINRVSASGMAGTARRSLVDANPRVTGSWSRHGRALVSGSLLDRLEQRRHDLHDAVSLGATAGTSLDDWDQVVLNHGRATRTRPAVDLLLDLEADCADLQRALASSPNSAAQRHLMVLTAQIAGLTFLTLIKLNAPAAARAWARTARVAASEAGDATMRSWVRAQEAYVYYYGGNLAEAVEVARHAQELPGRVVCVGVPLSAALEARAQAALGRRQEAIHAMRRAETAAGLLDNDALAESAFGYNEAQLRFHQGNALTLLGDTDAALTAQQQALQLYPATDFLDRTLVRLDRATCLTRANDGDIAAATAEAIDALSQLTTQQRQGLITVRGKEVLAAIPPQARTLPAARDLHDLLMLTNHVESEPEC